MKTLRMPWNEMNKTARRTAGRAMKRKPVWSDGFCDYLDRLREQNERETTTDRNEEEKVE
jgi:hypothetical protein